MLNLVRMRKIVELFRFMVTIHDCFNITNSTKKFLMKNKFLREILQILS